MLKEIKEMCGSKYPIEFKIKENSISPQKH